LPSKVFLIRSFRCLPYFVRFHFCDFVFVTLTLVSNVFFGGNTQAAL